MRIVHFEKEGVPGIAANDGAGWHGLTNGEGGFPGTLPELIAQGADLLRGGKALLPMHAMDLNAVRILPPVLKPPKILCVGLNYDDHLEESGLKKPVYPEIFARYATSFIAHREPIRRPCELSALDYEAELAVVIGREGAASTATEPSIMLRATPCSTMRRYAIFNCARRNGRWARISMAQEPSVPG